MIRTIKVEVNAAYPNMPLEPFQVFNHSAAAVTVVNVPRRIASLSLRVKNVSGIEKVFHAQRTGSAWVATIDGDFFAQAGTSTRGVKVEGADESGKIYVLGAADLVVLLDNGTITPVHPGGEGDVKHSDFADMSEKDGMTLKEVGSMVNTLVRKLKGTVVAFAAVLAFAAFAEDVPLSPDMDFGDVHPTQKLAKAVHAVVDGAARPLPRYLHALDFDDTYPDEAAWYYAQPQDYGSCSAVRDGGFLYRNYDWKFDDAAEFVVKVSCSSSRFASVGVANVGTNLTEEIVTRNKPSRYYKCLPGRVVDGINENGVVCEVNVVGGEPQWGIGGDIHPLGAVRWVLDNATSAEMAASNLAVRIAFPSGFSQNFHWMIADERETYIVANGNYYECSNRVALTNFPLKPTRDTTGEGQERYDALTSGASITSQWWTLTYTADGYRASDIRGLDTNLLFRAWAAKPKEAHRGETFGGKSWWQTVHTSIYDITNRTLRIAVQETDDWYTFAVPSAGGVKPEAVREIVEPMIGAATNGLRRVEDMAVYTFSERTWVPDYVPPKVWSLESQPEYSVMDDVWFWRGYDTDGNPFSAYAWDAVGTNAVFGTFDYLYIHFTARVKGALVPTTDRLATTNGVAQAIANKMDKPLIPIEYGTVLVANRVGDGVEASAYTASDLANLVSTVADKADRATTLLGYGITNAYTKTETEEKIVELAPAPGNYAAVSNAAMNAVQMVTNADANLIYTITSDGAEPRFYFTPVGAINAED